MKEERKDIIGYEGKYQISSFGNIKSLNYKRSGKEKVLKQYINKDGYMTIYVCKDISQLVSRLKAITFIPNTENKKEVNHRDGNRLNNGYHADGKDNCEWATHGENQKHSYDVLGKKAGASGLFGKNIGTVKKLHKKIYNEML